MAAAARSTWTWRRDPVEPGPCVVVDLDGVLSDVSGRLHLVDGARGRKDWDAFFAAVGEDPLIPEIARLLELLDPALAVVLLTARPVKVRAATLTWLERHGLAWDLLVMRKGGDFRPSPAVKGDEVAALREYGFDPRLALEDDDRNVEMFEEAGVRCLYVHSREHG